ncbi:hypothetical protein [Escherichia coli]|nr:hypothetical protein [Escherichia coli]
MKKNDKILHYRGLN